MKKTKITISISSGFYLREKTYCVHVIRGAENNKISIFPVLNFCFFLI